MKDICKGFRRYHIEEEEEEEEEHLLTTRRQAFFDYLQGKNANRCSLSKYFDQEAREATQTKKEKDKRESRDIWNRDTEHDDNPKDSFESS